jgi:hypothetical protein
MCESGRPILQPVVAALPFTIQLDDLNVPACCREGTAAARRDDVESVGVVRRLHRSQLQNEFGDAATPELIVRRLLTMTGRDSTI